MPKKSKQAYEGGEDYIPRLDPKQTVEIAVKALEKGIETIEGAPKNLSEKPLGKKRKSKKTYPGKKAGQAEKQKFHLPEKLSGNSVLVITEKPQAAAKISAALSGGRARMTAAGQGVFYYEFAKEGQNIIVACAVGHLFALSQNAKGSKYPVFDISWKPNFEVRKKDFTRKYYSSLEKLMRRAKEIIIATDYDVEGEVIGYNIIRFIAGEKDAKRMKFSSLTSNEIEDSYKNVSQTIDWGQAIAGETRHYIDWFYGINLSRALMSSIKSAGKFRIMSIGRVQGPALNLIVKKEEQIALFKPEPFWRVFINLADRKDKSNRLKVRHIRDLKDKKELKKFESLEGKEANVDTKKSMQKIPPPAPFDLTTLQIESYKFFYFTPAKTLQIAQQLYLAGLISYPRTSSQKIPSAINPRNILKRLAEKFSQAKLAGRSNPVEGRKSDPAHPSIYPTGEFRELSGEEKKIYEMIVKRFISCFCPDALVENKIITADAEGLVFKARGLEIKEKGWMDVYNAKLDEKELKDMNGKAIVEKVDIEEDKTKPPKRYSPASIVSELEKRGLGTKCLTGDTKILINKKETSIEEIFNKSKPFKKEGNIEIREIDCKTLSLNNNKKIMLAHPRFISKRKIRENEEVIVVESPSAIIKLTGDHKVYITQGKNIDEIPAKELKIENKLLALVRKYEEGEILFDKSKLKDKYKIKNEEILHKFSSKSAKGIKINSFPIRWSTSLAWVLGYFYGDGSYSNPKYNGSNQISFTTTEEKALNLLKENIKNIFGNEPYCYNLGGKYKVDCNSMISYVLIKIFPNLEGKKPIEIPREFMGDFLRGFFDADGNVHLRPTGKTLIKGKECNSFDTPRIKITLANEELINWISSFLLKIGIENNITKTYALCRGKKFDCWTIGISNRERVEKYAYNIGFDSYKEAILFKGLKCNSRNYKVLKNSARVYLKLAKQRMKPEEISSNLKISQYEVKKAINHLRKLNLIDRRRIGYGSSQKWVYSVENKNLAYEKYCIKMLYTKIAKDIYELPIERIDQEGYKGDVYDISVEKNSPNFTIVGNILVHNSTRANIIETLYNRNYITDNKSIKATPLGMHLIESLEKYSPVIIDENLTKQMEKDIEHMQTAKNKQMLEKNQEKILEAAKISLNRISEDFRKNEKKIGEELVTASEELWKREREENELGECPVCKKGRLIIKYSPKYKRKFIACSAYPECKTTFGLPPTAVFLKKTGKMCPKCGFPTLMSIKKGRRPWFFCFNPKCESRKSGKNQNADIKTD